MESDPLTVGAWLPNEWQRLPTDEERELLADAKLDLLVVPATHDRWETRDAWRQLADELDAAVYVGLTSNGWSLGLFTAPGDGHERVHVAHSSADHTAFERSDWTPDGYLDPVTHDGTAVGLAIGHDHHVAPIMGYEALRGANLLLHLGATPVRRHVFGEVLQARAIENAAYVVSTTHGLERDGGKRRTDKGHVFAFGPAGAQLQLEDVETKAMYKPFETTPGAFYRAEIDPSRITQVRRESDDWSTRPAIDRIRENRLDAPTVTETTLRASREGDQLLLEYGGERVRQPVGDSGTIEIGDTSVSLVTLSGPAALEPERLYDALLDSHLGRQAILIHNNWTSLDEQYLDAVVEPVLRARCVEWCSPVLVSTPSFARGYQLANSAKATHELPKRDGMFPFELRRAYGVSTALEPVDQARRGLRTLTAACAQERQAGVLLPPGLLDRRRENASRE